MITQDQLREVIGSTVYDGSGDKVGHLSCADETDQPKWLTVHTGLFGGNETFVPMQGADIADGGRVTVAYDKAMVKDAPNVDEDGRLSVEDELQLYRYCSLDTGESFAGPAEAYRASSGRHSLGGHDRGAGAFAGQDRGAVGHDTTGPTTDAAMTRSEEQLNVGRNP
jgi:hypothetical protein